MTTQTKAFDTAKSEAFSERLLDILNGSALALLTSIGHRTGLFDAMKSQAPATADDVARMTSLNARYVREWLDGLVTGGFVAYDPVTATYQLPDEHAAWLTRDAAPDNIAVPMQYVSVLGSVEDRIVECFRAGGGVPYVEFKRFHEVMAEDSGQTVVAGLLEHILPADPSLIDRLKKGIEVLDVGCGSGRALAAMAKEFPASRFTGYDFSDEAITRARAQTGAAARNNLTFEVKDVASLGVRDRFDLITAFDVVHDQAKPDAVLREIHTALAPGGLFLMQDIAGSSHVHKNMDHPLGPFMYTISTMHCMTVSLALGGAGLGTMWGEERATKMLKEAGFTSVELKKLPHDIQNTYYLCRTEGGPSNGTR